MDKLRIGIFGDCPITNVGGVVDIISAYIDSWIERQSFEVRPSHIEVVGISEPRGVVAAAKEYAESKGYGVFTVPLLEQRYKNSAKWMRNAAIIERINYLLIIKRPKKSQEYLQRLETKARENGVIVVTALLHKDGTLDSLSR